MSPGEQFLSRRTLIATALLAGCGRRRASGFDGYAFVATATSHAVVVVDLTGFAVRKRIALDAEPSLLVNHPRRPVIYALAPQARAVYEIDAERQEVARRASLRGAPRALQIAPDGARLWVSTTQPAGLVSIDAASFAAGPAAGLEADPIGFDITADGSRMVVLLSNRTLRLIDLATGRREAPIALGADPGAVHFRLDGKQILVAERGERQLRILDTETRRVVVELPLALRPDHWCFKSDGGQLFLTGEGRDAVVVAYPYQTEIAQTSLSGHSPGAMAVCESPEFLFVANPAAGSVTVFDIATQRVVAVTAVGREPGEILITPDQQYALVLNRGSGDMAVIRLAAVQPGPTKRLSLFTLIPVGDRPVSGVVRRAT